MNTTDERRSTVEALRSAELQLEDDLTKAKTDLATARQREADSALTAVLSIY